MNATLKLPKDQVESLRPGDVQHYLTSRGWDADPQSPPSAAIFHHPVMGDAEIVLPLRRDLGDYTLRMADVVQALTVLEKRSYLEVLNDLSTPPSDVLRLRVIASEATLGNLPIEEGIQLLRGGRDMLLSAACSTIRPQAFHPEKTLKQANEFIKGCRMGQTERGSFVATIMAPVPPEFRQLTLLPGDTDFQEVTEPFARRVTARLMNSLGIVDQAVKTARFDPIINGVEDGVSANLCEAVTSMRPPGDQSRIDIRMSWSRSRPKLPKGVPEIVSFSQGDFQIVEEAGRRLRQRAIPRRERFVGKVLVLQSEIASLFDDLAGKIVIRTEVGGQRVRVKLVLNRDDYRLACDAHRDGRPVAVTGIIHHDAKVRVYELSEPGEFRVLDDD